MHQHAVAHLDRRLDQILVRALHRVAGLERGHARPAQALELRARLGRRLEKLPYFAWKPPSESTFTGPARLNSGCAITIATPGCAGSAGAEHRLAFPCLVDSVTLDDAHRGERSAAVRVDERDFVPRAIACSEDSVIGIGQNRPAAMRKPSHTPSQSACVMKPVERREAADTEHHQVALFPRADAKLRQRLRARDRGAAPRRSRPAA